VRINGNRVNKHRIFQDGTEFFSLFDFLSGRFLKNEFYSTTRQLLFFAGIAQDMSGKIAQNSANSPNRVFSEKMFTTKIINIHN